MSRRRMQGSAEGAEPETLSEAVPPGTQVASTEDGEEEGPRLDLDEDGSSVPTEAGRGTHQPLGGRKGVKIMFNATQHEGGITTPPGERVVSAEEAATHVKAGLATYL